MKHKGNNIAVQLFILMFVGFLFVGMSGCGGSGSPESDDNGTDSEQILSSIGLVAERSSINPGEVITITAIAYDTSGRIVPGKKIDLILDDPTLGSITANGITGADGTFQATFTARSATGKVDVTALSESVTSTPKTITIMSQSAAVTIALSVNPTKITATNTATITAIVTKTTDGSPVENGTTVTFSVEDSAFGTISPSATTNAGKATATFIANNFAGTAAIKASAGSATASVNVVIEPVEAASIEFGAVSHNPIAIRGTGGQESANITFNVKDVNGNPAEDIDVVFTVVSGVQGAEYLEENDDSPYTQTVGTSSGLAEITLHSGYEAGVVSIIATIMTANGDTISATTPVISIGGGVPTDDWFTVSCEEPGWNLGGLECVGIETTLTAWLADRFGNYNVLDGHNVFFESEVGLAVFPNGVTDGDRGTASSVIRTQGANGAPKDVVPETWEETLKEDLATKYGFTLLGHPRDGVCSVLIFTKGEESFADGSNGGTVDGIFNAGEWFNDTFDDPWRDYDDDRLWDDGTQATPLTTAPGVNPMEDGYQDRAGNDVWDGLNNAWDGNKNIYRQVDFLITGKPVFYVNKGSFTVHNGGSDTVHFIICDQNYNRLSAGSAFTVSVDAGKLAGGTTTFEYPSSSFYGGRAPVDPNANINTRNAAYVSAHRGLIEHEITIADNDPTKNEMKFAGLKITVTWKSNGNCADEIVEYTIPGVIDAPVPPAP